MPVSKGPLNYTTEIKASKTAAECVDLLALHGASSTGLRYGPDRNPVALTFAIRTQWGMRDFDLPVNIKGTLPALERAYQDGRIRRSYVNEDQAFRTAWRVVKTWLEVQLAMIEAGVVDLQQVMLPYLLTGDGRTLYEIIDENQMRALEA